MHTVREYGQRSAQLGNEDEDKAKEEEEEDSGGDNNNSNNNDEKYNNKDTMKAHSVKAPR